MQELIWQSKLALQNDKDQKSQKISTFVTATESMYCRDLKPSQVKMVSSGSADKETIKSYLAKQPYITKDSELVYRGYYFLQYEKDNINNGSASIQSLNSRGFSEKMVVKDANDMLQFTQWLLGVPMKSSKDKNVN